MLAAILCTTAAAQSVTVSGTVRDSSGAVVAGAEVTLRLQQSTRSAKTGPDGGFTFAGVSAESGSVRVTATSFAPAEQKWTATADTVQLSIILQALPQTEQVVV